jgi:hypothetical protein
MLMGRKLSKRASGAQAYVWVLSRQRSVMLIGLSEKAPELVGTACSAFG